MRSESNAVTSIRLVTVEDVKSLARVHVDSWCETYTGVVPKKYLESLKYTDRQEMWEKLVPRRVEHGATIVVTGDDGDVVGFCDLGPAREHEHGIPGEIYAIYLLKRFQKQGVGKKMLDMAKDEFRKRNIMSFYLWVLKDNPTRDFYESQGGEYLKSQPIDIGGVELIEELYVFDL